MKNTIIVCVSFVMCAALYASETATLKKQINALLAEEEPARQEMLITHILEHDIDADTLLKILKGIDFHRVHDKGIQTARNLCIDDVERAYYYFVPSRYDHREKTPLLVYLHGGVSRSELIEGFEEYARTLPFTAFAEEKGYIMLFPLGQAGATWWDSVGIANVLQQIRAMKKEYNIDDSRVFMTGFSDGGSGSFLFAMCYPTDFAGFMPLNGHPGVGSEAGSLQTYFVNLFNRPLYVVNTDEDELYPAEKIRKTIELAHDAGADISYRIYTGIGHDFAYADEEMPRLFNFMVHNPRELNPRIVWESAYSGLQCAWLSIDTITDEGRADWHTDHNMELTDERVMFGFYPDENFEGVELEPHTKAILTEIFPDGQFTGPGARVDRVVGDSTLCALAGMKDGDIIIKLDDMAINDMDDIYEFKEGTKCGDSVEIVVLRDADLLTLKGQFPGPTTYELFIRGEPSGRIDGYLCGNKFSFRTSQVGTFTIYIHPDMVQLDQNIVVEVDGREVFDDQVKPSSEFILRNFLRNRDCELLFVNKITVKP